MSLDLYMEEILNSNDEEKKIDCYKIEEIVCILKYIIDTNFAQGPYSLLKIKRVLNKVIFNNSLNYLTKFMIAEILEDSITSVTLLESIFKYTLKERLVLNINIRNWIILFLRTNIEDDKALFLLKNILTNDFFYSDKILYNFVRELANVAFVNNIGIFKIYDNPPQKKNTIVIKYALDYFYNFLKGDAHLYNYLVPILQLYESNNLFTEALGNDAKLFVTGNILLTNDLADFLYYRIGDRYPQLRIWARTHIHIVDNNDNANPNAKPNPNRINKLLTGSQSVHMLDKKRIDLVNWLMKNVNNSSPNFHEAITKRKDKELVSDELEYLRNQYDRVVAVVSNNSTDISKTRTSIRRITTDNTIIQFNEKVDLILTLENIFYYICFLIALQKEDEKILLIQRMQEELIDMSGTCYSGHLNRLFNVFTGILDVPVYVDVEKELIVRIKCSLKDLFDSSEEKIQDEIMEGMMNPNVMSTSAKKYITEKCERLYNKMYLDFKTSMDIEIIKN
jgi:hypothetical protein